MITTIKVKHPRLAVFLGLVFQLGLAIWAADGFTLKLIISSLLAAFITVLLWVGVSGVTFSLIVDGDIKIPQNRNRG